MFCLGCGAEVQAGAARCVVCGREASGVPANAQWSGEQVDRAIPAPDASGAPVPVPTAPRAATPTLTSTIPGGDPDTPGFPRDVVGRALLITVLAMMLDLLAPWVNIFGTRQVPAQVGIPALVVVALLGVALTPLTRPSLRRRPAAAVLPLVVGAAAFGVALFFWTILFISGRAVPGPSSPVADFGLYLFLFGGGVLVYCGYRMVVEAARASVPAVQMSPEALAPLVTAVLARMNAGGQAGRTVPGPQGPLHMPSYQQPTVLPRPPAVPTPILTATSQEQENEAANGAKDGPVALPGSAAWSMTPEPPTFVRPSPMPGWQRGNPRR